MKFTLKVEQEFDIKTLQVRADASHWEDAEIDGVPDTEGTLTPCREGDLWCPNIDIETGVITNWEAGKTASIHFKVCDSGNYKLIDDKGAEVSEIDGYAPSSLCPKDNGYGDYIIMDIDANGKIDGWKFKISDFDRE